VIDMATGEVDYVVLVPPQPKESFRNTCPSHVSRCLRFRVLPSIPVCSLRMILEKDPLGPDRRAVASLITESWDPLIDWLKSLHSLQNCQRCMELLALRHREGKTRSTALDIVQRGSP
jgi:hypothetical protein